MVENHKDKIFQKPEEAEAIRKTTNRKMNNEEQGKGQVHEYIHGGSLQRNTIQEEYEDEQRTGGQDIQ
eukprot:4930943-Heterocapsa_arctica.AAC.1